MSLGPWQLIIIALVILVLFGRGRISEMMGDFGKGIKSFKQGMNEVQDYIERAVRQRIAALPDGTWKSVDYIDRDPSGGEGMIPIRHRRGGDNRGQTKPCTAATSQQGDNISCLSHDIVTIVSTPV